MSRGVELSDASLQKLRALIAAEQQDNDPVAQQLLGALAENQTKMIQSRSTIKRNSR